MQHSRNKYTGSTRRDVTEKGSEVQTKVADEWEALYECDRVSSVSVCNRD